jgi:hypothetical protein
VIPRKAYSRVLVVRTASENLVLEPQQLPLLETLLENIECWPVALVAAGGLLISMYTGSGDREARLTPLASTVLRGERGLKRRPLAPHPHPRSAQEFKPAAAASVRSTAESLRSNYKPVAEVHRRRNDRRSDCRDFRHAPIAGYCVPALRRLGEMPL